MTMTRYNYNLLIGSARGHLISHDDIMHASVVQGGKEIFNINLSGITSVAEILRAIRSKVVDLAGIVVVKIRNCSQGWSQSKSLLIV